MTMTAQQKLQASQQQMQDLINQRAAAGGNTQGLQGRYNMLTNPLQVASWFAQQTPGQQYNAMFNGGNSPFGKINTGTLNSALSMGGLNRNALNQWINWNAPGGQSGHGGNQGYGVDGLWNFVPGGSLYGPSMYDKPDGTAAMGAANPWADYLNSEDHGQFNPNAYNGQTYNQGQAGTNPYHAGGFGPPAPGQSGLGAGGNYVGAMPQNYWDAAAAGNQQAMRLNQAQQGYNPYYSGQQPGQLGSPTGTVSTQQPAGTAMPNQGVPGANPYNANYGNHLHRY